MKKFDNFKEFSKNANLGDVVELFFKRRVPFINNVVSEIIPPGCERDVDYVRSIIGYLSVKEMYHIELAQIKGLIVNKYDIKCTELIKEFRIYQ